jgi:transaldolase
MKFFVDTADIDAIRDLAQLGIVDGVTTNPSLIMKSGRDIKEVTKRSATWSTAPSAPKPWRWTPRA